MHKDAHLPIVWLLCEPGFLYVELYPVFDVDSVTILVFLHKRRIGFVLCGGIANPFSRRERVHEFKLPVRYGRQLKEAPTVILKVAHTSLATNPFTLTV